MKRIKDTISAVLYRIVVVLVRLLPAKSGKDHLLLIKVDEIGDYMLFRHLLSYIRTSERFKDHKITLVGNMAWKQLFDAYDTDSVDDTIWLIKKRFNRDLAYRFGLLKKIRYLKTSTVINCIFSRSISLDDGFAIVATGKEKIAMAGDNANRVKNAMNFDKYIYSDIIDAGNERIFDTVRNKNFFNKILYRYDLPHDNSIYINAETKLPADRYIVIFIGAGNPERKWPMAYFAAAAKYAYDQYGLATVVCGGPPDVADAALFMTLFNGNAFDLAGKTTLLEYVALVKHAKLTISVDTGPMHIAIAVGCPVIGLFSGKFYRRYAPYPSDTGAMLQPVYPAFVDELIAAQDEVLYDVYKMKNDTIKLIPAQKVLPYIDKLLGESKKD